MQIGIPGGLLFYRYEPFIRTLFHELKLQTEYSAGSSREILDLGTKNCIDEACLPVKIFHGHVLKLQKSCDAVLVSRIMTNEFGESICPKFRGLPELVVGGTGKDNLVFTEPLYLDRRWQLQRVIKKGCRQLGIPGSTADKALLLAMEKQRTTPSGFNERGYRHRVFLAGHPYNIYDSFANLDLIRKLHRMDIGIVTEEHVNREEVAAELKDLIKTPYWFFLIHNYAPALALIRKKEINGIVYVSSFCCGTDSVTIEMLRNRIGNFPFLVLKLDEQTGEAGYLTRLEAFCEVLK